jgi:hypothetical protein
LVNLTNVSYYGDLLLLAVSDTDLDIADQLIFTDDVLVTHFFGSHATIHLESYDGTAWTDINSAEGTATVAVVNEWVNMTVAGKGTGVIGAIRMVTGADNQIGRMIALRTVKTAG